MATIDPGAAALDELLREIKEMMRQAVVDAIREYEARRALPSTRRATSARLH
jgi:hypothetical protein